MPIVEATISGEIEAFMKANKETDSAKGMKKFADGLASVIANAIKSATIIVPTGIPVATGGTAVAQTGATTAPSAPATIK